MWKTLVYHGETYDKIEVSSEGKIRNAKSKREYRTFVNQNGYEQVCISLGGRNQKEVFRIHRAVAETFVSNPDNKSEVNHRNGDKGDNRVVNLEWVSGKENMKHAVEMGLFHPMKGTSHPNAKLSSHDVLYIREHYPPGSQEFGATALGRKFCVDKMQIIRAARKEHYSNLSFD